MKGSKMTKFRVKVGSHNHKGQLINAGETFQAIESLDKMFSDKIERVGGRTKPVLKEDVPPPPPSPKPDGELVDGSFEYSPEDTSLHVYKSGTKYHIYDIDDLSKPLNEKGLTKTKVMPFIESQCEEA